MNNVALAIVTVSSTIPSQLNHYADIFDMLKKSYDKIDDLDEDKEDYRETIQNSYKDIYKKYSKNESKSKYSEISDDNEIIVKDLGIIKQNKYDDLVIRNMSKLRTEYKKYKKLEKDFKEIIEDLENDSVKALKAERFYYSLACSKLVGVAKNYFPMIENEYKKIDFVGE